MRAYRGLGSFDKQAQFGTWLHRIVVNTCIDRLRHRAQNLVALDDVEGVLAGDDDPTRSVEGGELGGRIGAALAQLSEKRRTALVLRELDGLSYLGDRRDDALLGRYGDVAALPRAQAHAGSAARRSRSLRARRLELV